MNTLSRRGCRRSHPCRVWGQEALKPGFRRLFTHKHHGVPGALLEPSINAGAASQAGQQAEHRHHRLRLSVDTYSPVHKEFLTIREWVWLGSHGISPIPLPGQIGTQRCVQILLTSPSSPSARVVPGGIHGRSDRTFS
jgi:hypothetical protein